MNDIFWKFVKIMMFVNIAAFFMQSIILIFGGADDLMFSASFTVIHFIWAYIFSSWLFEEKRFGHLLP
jgi:hypothetical protein